MENRIDGLSGICNVFRRYRVLVLLSGISCLIQAPGAATEADAAQSVIKHPNPAASLGERWKWAADEARKRDFSKGFWTGYSILRLMSEHSYIGSYYSDPARNRPSLNEVITGARELGGEPGRSSGNMTMSDGETNDDDDKGNQRKVSKEVAILFHFTGEREDEPDRVKVSNLSLRVDFNDDPLLWLGGAADRESITLLESRFSSARSVEVKKQIVRSIGLHEPSPAVFTFLRDLLSGTERDEIRGEGAFWLGQLNTDEALGALMHAAESDKSEHVRDQAVFGISQIEGDRGLDALIKLVREDGSTDVQKKAAFWLGQRASEKAIATLKDIVYSAKETELQKSALFALTQCSDGAGIDDIIKIAKTHPNPKIRKEAVFWLGQSEDKRAIDALIEIVRH